MDEYKQLKESLNRVPGQPQAAHIASESHLHEAQHNSIVEQPHKDEPVHEEDQHNHQDAESKVTWDFFFQYQDKMHTVNMRTLKHIFFLLLFCSQLGRQDEGVHVQSQHDLSEKEEDGEGEAERRRELAEEEMAQAGQPQKLEEDPDQQQDEQQEEEEETEQEQPDENALDRQRRQPQPVRNRLNPSLLSNPP